MLLVVGLGINTKAHVSADVEAAIKQADRVYYLLSNTEAESWLREKNSAAIDLSLYYQKGLNRRRIYTQIVQRVISGLKPDSQVCVVFYGHPGVFVNPGFEMVRLARKKGIHAKLLPAISADGCLYADLEFDPSDDGCQMYEATDFLHRHLRWEAAVNLILWQIGVVGHSTSPEDPIDQDGIRLLTRKLLCHYQPDHKVVIYEAAYHILQQPRIEYIKLEHLDSAKLNPISTLYIPPRAEKLSLLNWVIAGFRYLLARFNIFRVRKVNQN